MQLSLVLMALPLAAAAHAYVTRSSPANGSELATAPAEFSLTLNEAALVTRLTLQKSGESAQQPLGPLPKGQVQTVSLPAPKLGPGSYALHYRTLSGDGHIMSGVVKFSITGNGKASVPGK